MADFTIEAMIDYVRSIVHNQFSDEISQTYFGDVGVYPPKAFQDQLGQQRAVLSVIPAYDEPHEGGSTAAGEFREVGIELVCLINMVPYFTAMPEEAPAERLLLRLVTRIRQFLQQQSNITLGGNVSAMKVGGIRWDWVARGNNPEASALRAAGISVEAIIYVPKQVI